MSFDQILSELTNGIPECLASGVVDVPTGTVVGCKTAQRGFKHEFEVIAAATATVFAAAPSDAMNDTVGSLKPRAPYEFKEVTLMGSGRVQVYCRPDTNPDLALVVICNATANLGMVLAKTRLQLTMLEAQVS